MQDPNKVQIQCCSMNGQVCRNGKRDDFPINPDTQERYVCNEWVSLRGPDPQTGEMIDKWMCQKQGMIFLALENLLIERQVRSSVDKTANEVARHHTSFFLALNDETKIRLMDADPKLKITDGTEK